MFVGADADCGAAWLCHTGVIDGWCLDGGAPVAHRRAAARVIVVSCRTVTWKFTNGYLEAMEPLTWPFTRQLVLLRVTRLFT